MQRGHLTSRDSWYWRAQKLAVVGKYKYLGLNISTMLSFNIDTEYFVSRAKKNKKKYNRNLKSSTNLRMSPMLSVFKLFDAQIVSSLSSAAEFWDYRENKQIERVHLYACKLFIDVPTVASNDMIMVSWARYPLDIEAAAKCIHYWFRVLKQPATRYSKAKNKLRFIS